jgi:hypothetical protein
VRIELVFAKPVPRNIIIIAQANDLEGSSMDCDKMMATLHRYIEKNDLHD